MEREAYVEVAGRRQRYLRAGSGWPIILLHAFPLTADLWRPQLQRVPRGWEILAPDIRGFGPAAGPPATSVGEMAEGVAAFMDALEIDKAAIGGLSMGGYVTMALYRLAPERFSAMVLANTRAGADTPDGRAARDKMAEQAEQEGSSAVADAMLPKLLGVSSRRARPHLHTLVRRLIESNPAHGLAAALRAIRDRPDSTATLERSSVPGLIVGADEDTIIPAVETEAMARAIPRSQLVTLTAAGHLSNLEAPDDFSEALANFLRSNL